MKREIVGAFILSPLIAAISGDVALSLVAAISGTKSEFGWISAFVAFVAYPVVLVAGIPVFMLMRRKKWLSPKAFIFGGLFLAFIALAYVLGTQTLTFVGENATQNFAGLLLLTVVSGVVGGLTFMKVSGSDVQT